MKRPRLPRVARCALAALLAAGAGTGVAPAAATRAALLARWHAATPQSRPLAPAARAFPTPPAALRELARRELASAAYRLAPPATTTRARPLWRRLWQWLSDWWTRLWRAAFGNVRLGRGGAIAIGDALMGGALLLVALAAWRLLREVMLDRRRRARTAEPLAPAADAQALYAAATARARSGDYASASRLLFAAAVAALAAHGLVDSDRSATVGDLRRTLRERGAAMLAPFDAVSGAFVTGAYAELPVDAPAWERARSGFLRLLEADRA